MFNLSSEWTKGSLLHSWGDEHSRWHGEGKVARFHSRKGGRPRSCCFVIQGTESRSYPKGTGGSHRDILSGAVTNSDSYFTYFFLCRLHAQHGALCGAQSHNPWDQACSWNEEWDVQPTLSPRGPQFQFYNTVKYAKVRTFQIYFFFNAQFFFTDISILIFVKLRIGMSLTFCFSSSISLCIFICRTGLQGGCIL